jgi:hypothetical protein
LEVTVGHAALGFRGDLSKNDDVICRPDSYYKIPNAEDRLYVPEEFVPLYVEAGWRREA